MVDTKQLDAVLAEWRDATTPLDGKMSVDPSFFLLSSSSSLSLRSKAATRATALEKHEERKSDDQEEGEVCNALALRVDAEKSCRPWSHEDFLTRVSSFSIATWFAKPDAISVFACARHGWINTTQPDQLYCPCCEQYLCFKIDPKLSEKVRKSMAYYLHHSGVLQVASSFAKLLATGHSSLCPWRENPSPEAFTSLPIASPEQVLTSLEKRIEQILASCSGDSRFDLLSTLRIDANVVAKILQEVAASSLPTQTLQKALVTKFEDLIGVNAHEARSKDNISALLLHVTLLSVCGWQLDQRQQQHQHQQQPGNAASAIAWCETCNRRWSMSSFARPSSATSDQATVDDEGDECVERNAKRQKVAHPAAVDLIAQHRWFCPWVAARKPEASHELGVMSDELAKYGENDAKLWEFMLLPGWKQYAQALQLLVAASSSALSKSKKSAASGTLREPEKAGKPEQALESVRAVLGLPDW